MTDLGNFFAIDWRCAEEATRIGYGVNTALAYLTLARYTSRNHSTTTAAASALPSYTVEPIVDICQLIRPRFHQFHGEPGVKLKRKGEV